MSLKLGKPKMPPSKPEVIDAPAIWASKVWSQSGAIGPIGAAGRRIGSRTRTGSIPPWRGSRCLGRQGEQRRDRSEHIDCVAV